jgi:hypothetical protein
MGHHGGDGGIHFGGESARLAIEFGRDAYGDVFDFSHGFGVQVLYLGRGEMARPLFTSVRLGRVIIGKVRADSEMLLTQRAFPQGLRPIDLIDGLRHG